MTISLRGPRTRNSLWTTFLSSIFHQGLTNQAHSYRAGPEDPPPTQEESEQSEEQLPVLSFSREELRAFLEPLSLICPHKQTAAAAQPLTEQSCNRLLQPSKASAPGTSLAKVKKAVFAFFPVKSALLQIFISLLKTNC